MIEKIKAFIKDCLNNTQFKSSHLYYNMGFEDGLKCVEKFVHECGDGWISVEDKLPTQSDQYWVAYHPKHKDNPNEKTELSYCTAHFDEYEKIWCVKDQLFYRQRQCKVLFWQPIPQPPKE